MRREERVTVQGPVKEQQPDGMSHRGDVACRPGGVAIKAEVVCRLVPPGARTGLDCEECIVYIADIDISRGGGGYVRWLRAERGTVVSVFSSAASAPWRPFRAGAGHASHEVFPETSLEGVPHR